MYDYFYDSALHSNIDFCTVLRFYLPFPFDTRLSILITGKECQVYSVNSMTLIVLM